ncbi:hypothetical protein [Streptacidiphilus cavernicola]
MFLDSLRWIAGSYTICPPDRRHHQLATEVDHIEQGTLIGPGILYCRTDLAYRLVLDRAQAGMDGVENYQSSLRSVPCG